MAPERAAKKDDGPDWAQIDEVRKRLETARSLKLKNEFKTAIKLLEETVDHAQWMSAGPRDKLEVYVELAKVHAILREAEKSHVYAKKALDLVSSPGLDAYHKGMANAIYGWALHASGDKTGALKYLEKALSLFETAKDKDGIAWVCRGIGNNYLYKGYFSKAIVYYSRALRLNCDTGNEEDTDIVINTMALAKGLQGLYPEAIKDLEGLVARCTKRNNPRIVAVAHSNIAYFYQLMGDWDKALSHYEISSRIKRGFGAPGGDSHNIFGKAEVLVRTGDLNGAERLLEESFGEMMATGSDDIMSRAVRVRGILRSERGDLKKAEEDFANAEGIMLKGGQETILALNYIDWAVNRLRAKDAGGAKELFAKARQIYRSLKLSYLEKELDAIMARYGAGHS